MNLPGVDQAHGVYRSLASIPLVTVVQFLFLTVLRFLTEAAQMREGLTYSLGVQPIMVGEAQQRELETAGHRTSTVRKQTVMDACHCSALIQLTGREWCLPQWAGLPASTGRLRTVTHRLALRPSSQVILDCVRWTVNTRHCWVCALLGLKVAGNLMIDAQSPDT